MLGPMFFGGTPGSGEMIAAAAEFDLRHELVAAGLHPLQGRLHSTSCTGDPLHQHELLHH